MSFDELYVSVDEHYRRAGTRAPRLRRVRNELVEIGVVWYATWFGLLMTCPGYLWFMMIYLTILNPWILAMVGMSFAAGTGVLMWTLCLRPRYQHVCELLAHDEELNTLLHDLMQDDPAICPAYTYAKRLIRMFPERFPLAGRYAHGPWG